MSIISKIASFLKEKDSYGSLERDFKKKVLKNIMPFESINAITISSRQSRGF